MSGWQQSGDIDDLEDHIARRFSRHVKSNLPVTERDSMGLAGVAFTFCGLVMLAASVWMSVDLRWFGATVTAFVWALVLFVVYRQTRR